MDYVGKFKKLIRQVIKDEHPDLLTIHYPVFGRISKINKEGENEYADIKILDKDKNPDKNFPELPRVKLRLQVTRADIINKDEIKVLMGSEEYTLNYPEELEIKTRVKYEVGSIVRVGFYYNDIDMPYVDGLIEE